MRTVEPEQLGEKRVLVERDAQTPLLYLRLQVPGGERSAGPGHQPADVRAHRRKLLAPASPAGRGEEARHRSRTATSHEGFDPGLTWLQLTLPEGAKIAEVEKVLDAALAQVVAQGVTDAELTRAKNLYASSFWKQLATINGKASLLGQFEVFEGDYRKLFDSPATYEKVTREDVQKAAALVFQKNHRTVGVLEAKP